MEMWAIRQVFIFGKFESKSQLSFMFEKVLYTPLKVKKSMDWPILPDKLFTDFLKKFV
jgi:hypothetical protein